MRIAHLVTQTRGGPVDHTVDVAAEQVALGHDVHLVSPDGPHLAVAAAAGVHVHTASMTGTRDLRGARDVAARVRAIRPDVLHAQDRRAGLVGRTLARPRGAATVYTLHGVPDPMAHLVRGNDAVSPPDRRVHVSNAVGERWLSRVPRSIVVTPCEAVAEFARDHLGLRADRVVSVPNGVDPAWADLGSTNRLLTDDVTTVAWLGVMQPVKRVPELVAAAAAVPGVRLLLIGDGPERGAVEAAVARSGAADRIELVGFADDPAPLLARADVLALPSGAEACPLAVLQAMASGLPVVASSVGGIPEVVRHGVDGLLVAPGDAVALRDALRTMHVQPGDRRRMGESARARLLDGFTVRHCADRLLAVYEQVAA
ncbi:glycosyltransferase family 4 protein [Aeromicrobium sp. Leaf350]|uniref:glycosyltransferase family 4 protein n=1 Tax=Aeromicrobium sp. Leaf350 TaxID=2876565 RepID=UPI001E50B252|nr:glycosyltransferase family 4 protein [Aeromicrobium sp. Leaf350]